MAVLENTTFVCKKNKDALKIHAENHCAPQLPGAAGQQPLKVQMVQRAPALGGVHNLAIKIHKLNFGFHALNQGGIFLYTFIWFQIGLSHNCKHSETPWCFNASKITWAFKIRFILAVF